VADGGGLYCKLFFKENHLTEQEIFDILFFVGGKPPGEHEVLPGESREPK
jgi:hypothetical protein